MTDARCQLEQAISGLREARSLSPLSVAQIESHVHTLLVSGGAAARKRKAQTSKQTYVELQKVAKQAADLNATLKDLLPPAASIFRRGAVARMQRQLHTISIIAQANLDPLPAANIPSSVNGAQQLALAAAYTFLMVTAVDGEAGEASMDVERTGVKPTIRNLEGKKAGGPFIAFLEKVFAARGVTASLENSARRAIQLMESSRSKRTHKLHF